jgi:hypothetical protein
MRSRSRGSGVAVAWVLLTIVTAAACVDYDPRAYDEDPPSSMPSTTTPTGPVESGSPVDVGSASHVVLAHAVGDGVTINVADGSGTLVEAASGVPGDGASVEPGRLLIVNDDPSTLRLTWVGGPCAASDVLLIDPARRTFVLGERGCGGDSIVSDRVLILRFSTPIDAAEIDGRVQDGFDTIE